MEVVADTFVEAWEESIRQLLRCDQWVPSERGLRALELRNVLLVVRHPEAEPRIPSSYAFNQEFVNAYCDSFRRKFPSASIRQRLVEYGPDQVDQLRWVMHKLQGSWHTRRAVVTFWEPKTDTETLYPPCPTSMQFLIRNNALELTVVLRSNDAWMAAVPDYLSLFQIQSDLAADLGIPTGPYTHLAVSYHLYELDRLPAVRVFGSSAASRRRFTLKALLCWHHPKQLP